MYYGRALLWYDPSKRGPERLSASTRRLLQDDPRTEVGCELPWPMQPVPDNGDHPSWCRCDDCYEGWMDDWEYPEECLLPPIGTPLAPLLRAA